MFNKKKYFFVSAFSTAIVLSMMLGFIVVEKNVSAIITPKKPPLFSYHSSGFIHREIKIHFMGKDFAFYLF